MTTRAILTCLLEATLLAGSLVAIYAAFVVYGLATDDPSIITGVVR